MSEPAASLHQRTWGSGPPVIALHPLGLESSAFAGFGRSLAKRGFQTIAVDLPGFGRTPTLEEPLTPRALAQPVIALARTLTPKPVVLGVSMGGRVAVEAALLAPDAFAAVIPIAPYMPWRRFRFLLEAARWIDPRLAQWMPLERAWPLLEWLAAGLETLPYLRDDDLAQSGARLIYNFSCPATRASFLSATRELALDPADGPDGFWERLRTLAIPATFIWGTRDRLVTHKFAGHATRALPTSNQLVLPCVAHWWNGPHHRCLAEIVAHVVAGQHEDTPDVACRIAVPDTAPTTGTPARTHLPFWEAMSERVRALDLVTFWAASTERALDQPPFQHDPEFIARLLPLMEYMNAYFGAEVRGLEHVPAQGPMLLVGNHSGGLLTPDTVALLAAWYRTRGVDSPLIGLAYDAAFGLPGVGTLFRKIGEVPASRDNAQRALEAGAAVLVYPGGEHEVYRPWGERNQIDLGGRTGFIELALRAGIPVVPVVAHGGHESVIVLSRGEWLARLTGLGRVRASTFPIVWQLPWGISPAGLPGLPLPSKITLQVLPPLRWSRFPSHAADDPTIVQRCYDEITTAMQTTLTQLATERPLPVWSRLSALFT